jgi:hypothetical protein
MDSHSAKVVPAVSAEEIVPSTGGDVELVPPCRALWVGTGGTVVGILATDEDEVAFTNVQDGTLLPFAFRQISSIGDGTTAEGLVALR